MPARKKTAQLHSDNLKMVFGDDVRWLAEGPAFDRMSNYKGGATVELQGDYARDDGRAVAIVLVAKNGQQAQATFKPGRDIMFSHEMDNETSDKAWHLADQLVAILDIRQAADLVAAKRAGKVDWSKVEKALTDLDPAYLPKDQLVPLFDALRKFERHDGAGKSFDAALPLAKHKLNKAVRAEAAAASTAVIEGAKSIKTAFKKVAMGDESAVDDMLYKLQPTFEMIDKSLPFLRREFLSAIAADRTARALSNVAHDMDSLTDGFKTVFGSFGDRAGASAKELKL